MTKYTLDLMCRIERRLNTYVGKEVTHCGHEGPRREAHEYGTKLLKFIEEEIEKLAKKAGEV